MKRDDFFNSEDQMSWLQAVREMKYQLDFVDLGIRKKFIKTSLQSYLRTIDDQLRSLQKCIDAMPDEFEDNPLLRTDLPVGERYRRYNDWCAS